MKKQLLLLATAFLSLTSVQAQCTITPSCTPSSTSGYCTDPLQGATLPAATVGANYSTIIQVSVSTIALGGSVQVLGVTIDAATLPAGLTYSTNPANGQIPGGSNACIEISGVPTTEWMGFNVTFDVTAMTDQGSFPQSLNFNMDVNAGTASIGDLNANFGIAVSPNPATDILNIRVSQPTTVQITNVLGQSIQTLNLEKETTLDIASWKNSVYFITDLNSGNSLKIVKR